MGPVDFAVVFPIFHLIIPDYAELLRLPPSSPFLLLLRAFRAKLRTNEINFDLNRKAGPGEAYFS